MRRMIAGLMGAALLAACSEDGFTGPGGGRAPTNVDAQYEWVVQGWEGTRPVGQPAIHVTWDLPSNWRNEVFRVYGRRSGGGGYQLLATVTSCGDLRCRYTDVNVVSDRSYDYYVATYDERSDHETSSQDAVQVDVPSFAPPPAPLPDTVVALDNGLYLRWLAATQAAEQNTWKYQVFLVELDDTQPESVLYQAGETDATGFLDLRAQNGVQYTYRVAAVDFDGHISEMSPALQGIPRPDYTAEVIHALADRPERSGFRFLPSDDQDPLLPGGSAEANWRLEVAGNQWIVRPVNGAQIHPTGVFTTALTCGPRSDADCIAVDMAPPSGYVADPVAVTPEFTYVLLIPGQDGPRYAKIRVTLLGSDQNGRLMVFDWAYQTRPGARALSLPR